MLRHRSPNAATASSNQKANLTMRPVTRALYLKYYAKDENGKYMGTEDPAKDCYLNAEDSHRWGRNPVNLTDEGRDLLVASVLEENGTAKEAEALKAPTMSMPPSNTSAAPTPSDAGDGNGKKAGLGLFKGLKGGGRGHDDVIR